MRKWLPRAYGTHHNTASTARNDKNPTREFRRINPGLILLKTRCKQLTSFEISVLTSAISAAFAAGTLCAQSSSYSIAHNEDSSVSMIGLSRVLCVLMCVVHLTYQLR